VEQSHRETDRLVAEKDRTEKELVNCQKEQVSLNSKMALVQLQLEQETKKIYGIESKLKARVDNLRRTQQANVLEKFKFEEKIERATSDLQKMQKDNERKHKLAKERVAQAEKQAEASKNKLNEVKEKLQEIEAERVDLKKQLDEYTKRTDLEIGRLVTEEHELEVSYNQVNAKALQLKTKIENIKNHSTKLKHEKKDMQIQCKAMKTKIANGEESLKTLHILMSKKKGEVAREQALNDELERQVKATEERIAKRTQRNKELLESRRIYLRSIMKNLRNELDRNENLAIVYKQIQAYNLAAKSAVLSINEKRSQIEFSVEEQAKIIQLQEKNKRKTRQRSIQTKRSQLS
jgi:chromosome segregation ATPase